MDDRTWLALATLVYLASAAWSIYALGARRPASNLWNDSLLVLAFILHSTFLFLRGQEIGHCPITNLFEAVTFLSWSLVLTYLAVGPVYRMSILGLFTGPAVFLVNFIVLVLPLDTPNEMPHMSWQLEMHASLTLLGFGTLGLAALAGVMYLIQERQLKRRALDNLFFNLPAVGQLDIVHKRVLLFAFALFSAGMIFGFFIPDAARLDWVKIVWSAGVWLLYAILLAAPFIRPISAKKTAWASVAGYVFVLLTFWGVNAYSESHSMVSTAPEPQAEVAP